jgi:hypothetical protein
MFWENAMGYEYDVFISYKHGDIDYWLTNIFLKRFNFALENELGRKPLIFFDQNIQKGDIWPYRLQSALAGSRCVVAFLQPSYFSSDWCLFEFGSMLERERLEGFRTRMNPRGLIQAVQVGDGVHFPPYARQIQWLNCTDHYSASLAFEKSEKCLELEILIKEWAPDVAKMINYAPNWKEDWINLSKVEISIPKAPIFSAPTLD